MMLKLSVLGFAIAFVATVPPASASPQFDQTAKVFTSAKMAGKRTVAYLDLEIRDPGGPDDKPKDAHTITWRMPKGTTYNPNALPVCIAEQAMAGKDCDKKTLVGGGRVYYNFAPLYPFEPFIPSGTLRVYNAKGAQYLRQGGLILTVDWDPTGWSGPAVAWFATLSGRGVFRTVMPSLTPREATMVFPLTRMLLILGEKKRSLLRTPRRCNPDKGWKSSVSVFYDRLPDGSFSSSTERDTIKLPCQRRS